MTPEAAVAPALPYARTEESNGQLLRLLLLLAWPVLAEHVLHMMVGINDTYLANHVVSISPAMSGAEVAAARSQMAAAAAAVGTVSYILWLIGLLTGAISAGSTAIIARATGARHRRLANSICGQSMSAGVICGIALSAIMYFFAKPIAISTGLTGQGFEFALMYFRMLSFAVPFLVIMFIANACLRGAGDTLTPATTFVVVDIVNIVFSWGLTYGMFGLPNWGFKGIAAGTVIAYCAGGVIQVIMLLRGRGGLRLYMHRLAPHWHNLKRILRIGIPGGAGDLIQWIVNFAMLVVVNKMDTTLVSSAAHNNTVKIESMSYLTGFAFATAAATMVGQSLGMRDPRRAMRSAYLSYAIGGGLMTLFGILFITLGKHPAMWLSSDPVLIDLTTRCLFVTGFCQIGFAAAMIFGGALRGAGDTLVVMMLNLSSIVGIRLVGVLLVAWYFKLGLLAMWTVLSVELIIRGALIYGRFLNGGWKKVEV
ncbi:MAG: MATE family efflux transporter [Anaerolineae bacterium]|nr:MATE family efflux transporter [Phycisphaerae bacterium]